MHREFKKVIASTIIAICIIAVDVAAESQQQTETVQLNTENQILE